MKNEMLHNSWVIIRDKYEQIAYYVPHTVL